MIPVFLIIWAIGMPPASHALTCAAPRFTLAEAYEAADSIIVGIVSECREVTSSDPYVRGATDCSFASLDVLKQSNPPRDYGGVASSSACGLSLHVGDQYLLFLDDDNQPMLFSAPLTGERYQARLASSYLQILTEFRDGVSKDLAEPWLFSEDSGQCTIRQAVRGHRITIKGRAPGAPQVELPEWTEGSSNGQTVFRATVPTFDGDMRVTTGTAEVIAYGTVPASGDDMLELQVSLEEERPATLRQATLSVANRTWPLTRMETILTHEGKHLHTGTYYFAAGNVVEDILSAMLRPSDIVVTATIVTNPSASVGAGSDTESPASMSVPAAEGSKPRGEESGVTFKRPSDPTTPLSQAQSRYRGDPPEPVLRLETRSTRLAREIESFRMCLEQEKE